MGGVKVRDSRQVRRQHRCTTLVSPLYFRNKNSRIYLTVFLWGHLLVVSLRKYGFTL
jgi:hypothetical protein